MARKVDIVGAGLAGLIAGNMLRHRDPAIFEAQPDIPNNHSAVLRFRSSIVGDVTGIPFRKVQMIKTSAVWRNPVADALAYSMKTGQMRSDRSFTSELVSEERYIAPRNLVSKLAGHVLPAIRTGTEYSFWCGRSYPCISTIPMPTLMELLNYPKELRPEFKYHHGLNIRGELADCDAYVTMYVPDPKLPYTRVSITGNELIVELPRRLETLQAWVLSSALEMLGIESKQLIRAETIAQKYAKIAPIDDDARRNFIHWATDKHGIFSLGRYGIWKPSLQLDDLVQDVRKIERWLGSDKYSLALAR